MINILTFKFDLLRKIVKYLETNTEAWYLLYTYIKHLTFLKH